MTRDDGLRRDRDGDLVPDHDAASHDVTPRSTRKARLDEIRAVLQAARERRQDEIRHAPNCTRPGTTDTAGHSVSVTRCDGCGAIVTERSGTEHLGQADP